MITAYSEKTTQELIDLLITEEDRVTVEHIQELATRPDAAKPLRELLQDDYYWYDADPMESWSLYHAFILLCLMRDQAALPDLLQALMKAHETDFDYLTEISHAALAQYGESAVDPLMEFINELKGQYEEDWVMTYPRSDAVTALTRIAFENPLVRSQIAKFVCELMVNETETDTTFLSFISDDAILLDREKGLVAVRSAYDRDLIDESINGNFDQFMKHLDSGKGESEWKYKLNILDFYSPEEIAQRQKQWQQEAEDEKRQTKEEPQWHTIQSYFREEANPVIPDGFTITDAGNFVREEKIGRNDPCPCGSGKKFKKCHGK